MEAPLLAALAEFCMVEMVEPVFRDFCARRSALIKALTDDFDVFFNKCDPNEKELCLYGDADGQWRVAPPSEYIPSHLPEPARGINLARDRMSRENWLNDVANFSDIWLLSMAFFNATSSGFRKEHREMLHEKIEQLPKILEVATIRMNSRAQVERVFNDFTARRRALVRALTDDAYEFYRQCNPHGGDSAGNILCLFGDTVGRWRVGPPADEDVPQDLPQPVRGINLFRDLVPPEIWLFWVARGSDIWLRSVTSFEVADIELHPVDRRWLHDMIEQLTTLYEVVDFHYF